MAGSILQLAFDMLSLSHTVNKSSNHERSAEYLHAAYRKTNKQCFPFSHRIMVIRIQVHSFRKGMRYVDDGGVRYSKISALWWSNVRKRVMISQYLDKMRLNRKYLLRFNGNDGSGKLLFRRIYFQ